MRTRSSMCTASIITLLIFSIFLSTGYVWAQEENPLLPSQTYTAEDGAFTIPYLATWEITQTGTNQVHMSSSDDTVHVTVEWGTASYLTFGGLDDAGAYPLAVLISFLQETGSAMPTLPQEVETNGIAFLGGITQGEAVFYAVSEPAEDLFVILDADLDSQETLDALEPAFMAMISGASVSMGATGEPTAEPTEALPVVVEITGPDDCKNVAASIGEYSSQFSGASYAPANLLDGDPATGWSSGGGVAEPEFVTIQLDGRHTVGGVLFNGYSPSPRYETDSIKSFRLEAGGAVIFEGEAALEQGYQVYTFQPVETDHIKLAVLSTHGGNYFEAADIMVCAVETGGAMPEPAQPIEAQTVRQWAVSATASSQYGSPDWGAMQATGAPDVSSCGDIQQAWASSQATGADWLRLEYAQAVQPTQINIYQTYNPGAVVKVEVVGEDGSAIALPDSADPPGNTPCPGVFTVDIAETLPPVNTVIVHLDQTITGDWNEIDAVELVGMAAGEVSMPAPGAVSCDIGTDRVVNTRSRPGTNYNVAGQLAAGVTVQANGQAAGADGYTWWRLTNGAWVRDDVVSAAADCAVAAPVVNPDEDPLPLAQHYTTPDGYSFDYPQGWELLEEPGGAVVGNSPAAAGRAFGETFEPGEFQVSVIWTSAETLAPGAGLGAAPTSMALLKAAISVSSGVDINEPYELMIGDTVVAAGYGTFADADVEMSVVIFEAGGGLYGSVLTLSDLDGMEQFEPTVRAIIASALAGSQGGGAGGVEAETEATPEPVEAAEVVELPETFTSVAEHLSIRYPDGWFAKDTAGGEASITTGQFVTFIMGMKPGEVQITINESITTAPSAMERLMSEMEQMASGLGFALGEATETTVGGARAARLEAEQETWHLLAMAVERSDGHYFDVHAYTHPDEFAQYEPLILAILDTITYTP
ncbi:MAG: hypothetical protein JXB47_03395 [Anaerolineae bacterium]|nr:hypothetical protein [Anaerolineae bacterium]